MLASTFATVTISIYETKMQRISSLRHITINTQSNLSSQLVRYFFFLYFKYTNSLANESATIYGRHYYYIQYKHQFATSFSFYTKKLKIAIIGYHFLQYIKLFCQRISSQRIKHFIWKRNVSEYIRDGNYQYIRNENVANQFATAHNDQYTE